MGDFGAVRAMGLASKFFSTLKFDGSSRTDP